MTCRHLGFRVQGKPVYLQLQVTLENVPCGRPPPPPAASRDTGMLASSYTAGVSDLAWVFPGLTCPVYILGEVKVNLRDYTGIIVVPEKGSRVPALLPSVLLSNKVLKGFLNPTICEPYITST